MSEPRQRIIVGISGASGAIYGVRLLQALRTLPSIETHAVISDAGWLNITHELGLERTHAPALADVVHSIDHIGASIASGSFHASSMVVAPCSMRTLAAVAHGLADNLLTRAADVVLKERRRLVLMVRESPLHLVHLRNMTTVTEMGGIICPPTLPRMPIRSVLTLGQPLVLVATKPWYSACWVARTLGICVASVAPICSTAFGSSAPAAKMPRGREYLKLRPMMSTKSCCGAVRLRVKLISSSVGCSLLRRFLCFLARAGQAHRMGRISHPPSLWITVAVVARLLSREASST